MKSEPSPSKTGACARPITVTGRWVIHFVNRDYESASDAIKEHRMIRLSLQLPSSPRVEAATLLSPDFDGVIPEFQENEGLITVTISRVQYYAMLILGSGSLI